MEVSGNGAEGLDSIRIAGIRHYGYTGFFAEEQVLGQWFEVNLTLWLDLATTGANDQLENTLNYAEVVAEVTAVMDAARFKTLERLNTAILERVLAFDQVRRAHSELVKLSPPIPGFSGQITIAMTRSKASGV
ncbi:MAG: dihydroneopterin aldolase [Cyanobacteria bacterium]|jgi:dihydroneopterin aldolase|nr:dihydroneopterin aldolase [Cyanobacteriota bacterium]